MKSIDGVGLNEVTSVYSGPQRDLYTLLMGQQLHVGGMNSSIDLAGRAEIGAGLKGIVTSRTGSIGAERRGSTIAYGSCSPTLARAAYLWAALISSGARTHGAMSRTKRNSSAKLQDWFDQVA